MGQMILHVECAANFASPVVPDARAARTVTAVGDVELVPVAPRATLRHFRSLEVHPAAAKVVLDDLRNRAAFDKRRQNLDRQTEERRHAGNVRLGAGRLHDERPADIHRLSCRRRDPDAHARRHDERVFAVLLQFDSHVMFLLISCFFQVL